MSAKFGLIRHRCASPKTKKWSRHSRRIEPIDHSEDLCVPTIIFNRWKQSRQVAEARIQEAEEALKRAELRIAVAEDQLSQAELRAKTAETRASAVQKALIRIESMEDEIRTHLLAQGRGLSRNLAVAA